MHCNRINDSVMCCELTQSRVNVTPQRGLYPIIANPEVFYSYYTTVVCQWLYIMLWNVCKNKFTTSFTAAIISLSSLSLVLTLEVRVASFNSWIIISRFASSRKSSWCSVWKCIWTHINTNDMCNTTLGHFIHFCAINIVKYFLLWMGKNLVINV